MIHDCEFLQSNNNVSETFPNMKKHNLKQIQTFSPSEINSVSQVWVRN